jgi:hypothetical protein
LRSAAPIKSGEGQPSDQGQSNRFKSSIAQAIAQNQPGLPLAELQAGLQDALAQLPGVLGQVHLEQSASAFPAGLQAQIAADRAEGKLPHGFDAVFWQCGIYLAADQLSSLEQAQRALLHDARHLGLAVVLGDQKEAVLSQAAALFALQVGTWLAQHKLANTAENRLTAAEEVLVELARRNPAHRFLDTVVAAIARFIRQLFPGLNLSKAELQELIAGVDRFLETGEGGVTYVRGLQVPPCARIDVASP